MHLKAMFKPHYLYFLVLAITGCTSAQAPAYQEDRAPENRTEYNGLRGVVQQQRDQNYLMSKTLSEKCNNAKVDLVVAQSQDNKEDMETQKRIINETCR